MSSPNLIHMRNAREKLKNNWLTAFLVGITVLIPSFFSDILPELGIIDPDGIQPISLSILSLIVAGPLALGLSIYVLNISRDNSPYYNNIFDGFKPLGKVLGVYFLTKLAVLTGIIFFMVPGIILGMGLSMSYFIMIDKPELGVIDTLKESWRIMKGNKTKFLGLLLRFVPWVILGLIFLVIGIIFVLPWMQVTSALFYEEIK